MRILVTGAAGFIGYSLSRRLLIEDNQVFGVDNLDGYYNIQLKESRLARLNVHKNFQFKRLDIADRDSMAHLFETQPFDQVVHLAAQAGVRYSIQNPYAYADSNLTGFIHVLEGCRQNNVAHLVYASSSSVYGATYRTPFVAGDNTDHPLSLYAATKKANELMAHAYSHLYQLPTTGLRFFTVYGPWGRPDMAYFRFVDAIVKDRPIHVYNHGRMRRDFTYIDDVVEAVVRVLVRPPQCTNNASAHSSAPYKVYNIGSCNPVDLVNFIEMLEVALGKTAEKIMLPIQPGDVQTTCADVSDLVDDINFKPKTSLSVGIENFVDWYHNHYAARPAA